MLRAKPDWLQPIFPWPQQSVVVNGRRMAYIDEGPRQGRPVLLLSGNPTWGFLYRDFIEPLREAGYRAIAPDWIGCGYSDHPRIDAALTLAHHIADLVSFLDQLDLRGFVLVCQDWGGPQGIGAALQRPERLSALILMNTWAFTGLVGKFHASPRPWTTWHAPLIGQFFMKREKVLSQRGPTALTRRGMSDAEARAYHHVFDEPDSEHVVLTWPRSIPMKEGDRGWADMVSIEQRLPELQDKPVCLLWAQEDPVFPIEYARRFLELLPQAEGPILFDSASHFLQDDRGLDLAQAVIAFLHGAPLCGSADTRVCRLDTHVEAWQPGEPAPREDHMNFIEPTPEELALLRADPLLWEQELDVRPDVAKAIEQACGIRAGRVYWRSGHDHLYALELADLGRGVPSMAMVYGFWDRFEPRPPEHEITDDLFDLSRWVARIAGSLDENDILRVAQHAGIHTSWPDGCVLRTPEEAFENLPDFPYEARFVEVEGLRMAYVEHGTGDPILCLHGEPTWGFLYRKMIPILATRGRVIVPDLIGFGRSDKPTLPNAFTYKSHARWLRRFIEALDLERITLICQDWGGLLGLRAVAAMPQRFARLVPMNTGLPTGHAPSEAFLKWRQFSQRVESFDMANLMRLSLRRPAAPEVLNAYAAPFPDKRFQTAALVFPRLVPIRPDYPGAFENRQAIEILRTLDTPVFLPWADGDPITEPSRAHLAEVFRNVQGSPTIANAGHFIQEDAGEETASAIVQWMSGL